MVVDYLQALFQEVKLDNFDVPGLNWKVQNVRFHSVHTNDDEIDIWIEGDLVKVRMREAGGSFTGVALSPRLWPDSGWHTNNFNF